MGQQVSVETFPSSIDQDGNKYWTSFDPYPFKVGNRKLAYMGILNGNGPLKGQKCVVKTIRNRAISEKDWKLETKRARVARDMANSYNNTISEYERKMIFNCPFMAEIDTLSDCMCLNDLIGKPKKKFKESEFVSIELYVRGLFEDFEYGWVSHEDLLEPEAFSHFSWCRSEGNLIVTNLQGVQKSRSFHFTGPIIHSEDKLYGSSDLGFEGIKSFFTLHKCNHVCRDWPRLGDGTDLRGWGEFVGHGTTYPSAPPLPNPPPYEEFNSMEQALLQSPPSYDGYSPSPQRRQQDQQNLYKQQQYQHQPQPFMRQRSQQQHQQRAPNRGQSMFIDGWEEFMNQNIRFGMNGPTNESMYQNQMVEMQFIRFVKQMNFSQYATSTQPPPYCTCSASRNGMVHDHDNVSVASELDYYSTDNNDDKRYLLPPPPYSEESIAPEFDSITYL